MENSSKKTKKIDENERLKTATIIELFSTADFWDILCMSLGTIGSIITGVSMPFFCILFGKMLDALNASPSSFKKEVGTICVIFLIVAVANVFSGIMQVLINFAWLIFIVAYLIVALLHFLTINIFKIFSNFLLFIISYMRRSPDGPYLEKDKLRDFGYYM